MFLLKMQKKRSILGGRSPPMTPSNLRELGPSPVIGYSV